MRLSKGVGKYLGIAEISLTNRLAYFWDHLGSSFFLVLILFIFSQLWTSVLSDGEIAGFNHIQMLWYMVFTEVLTLSSPATHHGVSQDVKSGEIAYKLVRPFSYPLFYFATHWGEFIVRFATNLTIGSVFAYLVMGPLQLEWSRAAFWIIGIGLATSLNFLMRFSLALLAFWVEDNTPFFWIYSKLIFIFGGLFVPVEAYPTALRFISKLLPFRYGVSAPSRLMVEFQWPLFWEMLAGQVVWLILGGLAVLTLYKKGVRQVHVQGG